MRADLVAYAKRRTVTTADREDPGLRSLLSSLLRESSGLVDAAFIAKIRAAAESTAGSVRAQVAKALGIASVDTALTPQIRQLVEGIRAKVEERAAESIDRARDVFADWNEEDPDELGDKLDEGLDGITGGAIAGATLIFGAVWAGMNQEAQASSGVGSYIWVAQRDPFTRPAHAELDDTIAEWRTPPLTADKSSNGEPCHAGDDYGCRCIAAPLPN